MQSNLQKLEEILKKCIDMGWRYVDVIEGKLDDQHMISYNDIFSVESWLLQFVKWKDNKNIWLFLDPEVKYFQEYDSYQIEEKESWCSDSRQYHAMMMSILPLHDKIQYFLENIDIDKPQ